ncbi:MAG: DUF2493 domain-containing protein [Eubacterium sp.]|nr:DUF2493 domain-containing protein [Eubacterium sp.]
MRVAIIGSRNLHITDLGEYLPENITEIVSGDAKGIDSDAGRFAQKNNVPMKEFLPDYKRYGRAAPLKRNLEIRIGKISDGQSPLLT